VTVIDGLADTVLATITGGSSPVRLCYNPVNSKVYVGDEDVQLMIIDCTADTLLNAGPGDAPYGVDVAYDALNDRVYTVYYDAFLVIDGSTNEVVSTQEFGTTTRKPSAWPIPEDVRSARPTRSAWSACWIVKGTH